MTMQKWERVYAALQQRSERLGYSPPTRIGGEQSQVYEFRVRGEPVLLLAFRDLARKEDYKVQNRLWAEGLDLVLERYQQLSKVGKRLPQSAAIVIDNIGEA